jgi:aryl-phospho-beta-D-glucosidase BglC (GH1 family)
MDMLQVQGGRIVDGRGDTVRLRGTCVGGWMNGEDFIDGYPGCEHGLRATMSEVIGPAKAHFFFERLLDYFFGEEDVAFIKSCGANVVRLPLNYRHFERDDTPFHYLEDGFQRLDQAIAWCARHGLYVILDLHAVQGWQNPDWHCDNASRHVLFWQHRQFQDRFVALWEEFARRYQGNPTVAGYNVMNEPVTNAPRGRFGAPYAPDWLAINGVYRRVVNAIRCSDPQHIIFLEGDLFSSRFEGLEAPFAPNLVYSSHNYNQAGFGPGTYPGQIGGLRWDAEEQNRLFQQHSGTAFARQHNVPLWVGEFGAAYNGPSQETPDRLRALDDQIAVFEEGGASWTTWTYKDIDVMGWVQLAPDSEYLRAVGPVLEAKRQMATDFWMKWLPATPLKQEIFGLADQVLELSGDPEIDPADNRTYLAQVTLSGYAALLLQRSYARCFAGMPEVEIDRVLQSFAFKNCRVHPLVQVVKKHMS